MAKRPSARWTGTVVFPELDGLTINGGLYSNAGKRSPLPLIEIHTVCSTRVEAPEGGKERAGEEKDDGEEKQSDSEGPQTVHSKTCPSCRRPVRPDELGYAVETSMGLITISDAERAGLKPIKAKAVEARLVSNADEILKTVGTGRRFYLLPKPDSVDDYYRLHAALTKSQRAGFITDMLIDKRAYVLAIRPIVTSEAVFGVRLSVLVVDEFADSDALKSPQDFQLLPNEEPVMDAAAITNMAKKIKTTVSYEDCLNPERRRFVALVKAKSAGLVR